MKWSRSFEGWLRWSLHWDLWIKLSVFGKQLYRNEQEPAAPQRNSNSLLAQMPSPVFTLQDAIRVRLQNGKKEAGTSNMINQWVFRKFITRLPDGTFQQLLSSAAPDAESR